MEPTTPDAGLFTGPHGPGLKVQFLKMANVIVRYEDQIIPFLQNAAVLSQREVGAVRTALADAEARHIRLMAELLDSNAALRRERDEARDECERMRNEIIADLQRGPPTEVIIDTR
jgi:hypothetical protein